MFWKVVPLTEGATEFLRKCRQVGAATAPIQGCREAGASPTMSMMQSSALCDTLPFNASSAIISTNLFPFLCSSDHIATTGVSPLTYPSSVKSTRANPFELPVLVLLSESLVAGPMIPVGR